MARAVKIALLGDSRSLQRALQQSETRMGRLQSSIGKMAGTIGKGFAVAATAAAVGAAAVAKQSIDVASNLEQSAGAVETIWGKTADSVLKYAAKNQKTLKATKQDTLDMATALGQAGIKSLPQLQKIMSGGSDLVAAFGGNMTDFTDAVSGAMRGEFDVLQKWVPTISAAAVETEVKLTGVSKQQAILNIVQRESAKVQGQAARESNTYAGMQQKLGIILEQIQEKIGSKLIPVLVKMGNWFIQDALPAVEKFVPVIRDKFGAAVDKVKGGIEKIQPFLDKVTKFFNDNPEVIRNVAIALGVVAAALIGVNAAMAIFALLSSPITLVALAIAGVVAGVTLLYKHNKTFRDFVDQKVLPTIRDLAHWFKDEVLPALKKLGGWIVENVLPILKKLGKFVLDYVIFQFKAMIKTVKAVIDVVKAIVGAFNWTKDKVSGAIDKVKSKFSDMKSGIKGAIDKTKDQFSGLRDRFSSVVGSYSSGGGGILGKAHGLVSRLKSVPGSLLESFKDLTKKPLKAVIDVAINPFIRTVNKLPGVDIDTVKGFARGGWTGPGGKYEPAGIVHADEFVINKASRRAIESKAPGFLDRLNGYASGGRVWPLKNGVTSTYAGHSGVDLNAPNDFGAPVYAVTSGTAYPYSSSWAGNSSVRLIGGGTSQIYAHLSGRGKLGKVHAGDVIGYVGSEGNSTGPHLHFQIDPMGYGPAMAFLRGASQPSGKGSLISGLVNKIKDFAIPKIAGSGLFTSDAISEMAAHVFKGIKSKIPFLAQGGIVSKPTLAMIGEAGPEAVIPLNRRNSAGGTKVENHYHVAVSPFTDPAAVAKELRKIQEKGLEVGIKPVAA